MKVTEQYFPVVLFIMLYKVILTFESVDEILKSDHSNKSYLAVLSYGPTVLLTCLKLNTPVLQFREAISLSSISSGRALESASRNKNVSVSSESGLH